MYIYIHLYKSLQIIIGSRHFKAKMKNPYSYTSLLLCVLTFDFLLKKAVTAAIFLKQHMILN